MHKNKIVACVPFALALVAASSQATTIVVTSRDPAGVGFNDPTPVAPVGGNPGVTLGEQRMNVYKYVAHIWEQNLDSSVPITVSAGWEALTCTSTTAVLGSASPWVIWFDFANSKPNTWYPQALANKLAGTNLSIDPKNPDANYEDTVDIHTQFNINLGNTGCLDGTPFYLGLDGNAGSKVNFVETLLHELGHGLGFTVLTVDSATGRRFSAAGTYVTNGGLPSIWEGFMYDSSAGKTWLEMTTAERKASAVNPLHLGWKSAAMTTAAAQVLGPVPSMKVTTPAPTGSGFYDYNTASFGGPVVNGQAFGQLATVPADPVNGTGCLAFDAATTTAVKGKVAIIDRGTCAFAVKAKNAQNAGAFGVIIANNAAGAAPGLGGSDPTVVIPTVSVSQADGVTLKQVVADALKYASRSKVGAASSVFMLDTSRRAGAEGGRPLLYTPATLAPGSSVSHFDVSAFPNLLMEPNINSDLTTNLVPPYDLTKSLLKDLGW
jgi:hypothetical protein